MGRRNRFYVAKPTYSKQLAEYMIEQSDPAIKIRVLIDTPTTLSENDLLKIEFYGFDTSEFPSIGPAKLTLDTIDALAELSIIDTIHFFND